MNAHELAKPLDRARVKGRKQGGMNVSYIEGWWAIAEANRIFGFEGWERVTVYNKEVCRAEREIGQAKKAGFKVGYEACVKIVVKDGDNYVERQGTGHGSGISVDLFDAIEGAAKEAETDAMKRALMTFGNQFGLALYDKDQNNVKTAREAAGMNFVSDAALVKGEVINHTHVDACYEALKEEIDSMADKESGEPDIDRMKKGMGRLNESERIVCLDKFGQSIPEGAKRMYKNIINDYLKGGE